MREKVGSFLGKVNAYGIILVACAFFFIFAYFAPQWKVEHTLSVVLQVLFWAGSSYLTYLKGESDSRKDLRLKARERYRRLSTLFKMMRKLAAGIDELEVTSAGRKPHESTSDLQDHRFFLKEAKSSIYSWGMNLKDCLAFWKDFAPKEVENLHRGTFREGEE